MVATETPKPKIDLAAAGLDLGGLGQHPMCAIVGLRARSSTGSVWYLVREFYEVRTTVEETVAQLHAWVKEFGIARIWADQSQNVAIQAFVERGLPMLANRVRDIEYGVRTMYGLLKTHRLKVDPRYCPHLCEELKRYSWKSDRSGQPQGHLPLDRNNHGIDATRFILVGEGESPDLPDDPILPEQQPTIYQGPDGKVYDNIKATIMRRKHPEGKAEFEVDWWDQIGGDPDDEDQTDEIRSLAQYLGMRVEDL